MRKVGIIKEEDDEKHRAGGVFEARTPYTELGRPCPAAVLHRHEGLLLGGPNLGPEVGAFKVSGVFSVHQPFRLEGNHRPTFVIDNSKRSLPEAALSGPQFAVGPLCGRPIGRLGVELFAEHLQRRKVLPLATFIQQAEDRLGEGRRTGGGGNGEGHWLGGSSLQ